VDVKFFTSQRLTLKICIFKGWTTSNETAFTQNEKDEHGGRLKVKIRNLFYGGNS
jgi:hypothetical protein